ncbi:MAG: DUF4861 family protein [Bacteroidetes bacterium]|nr:DUF4861 family protein [Bacteroidota bacterium]
MKYLFATFVLFSLLTVNATGQIFFKSNPKNLIVEVYNRNNFVVKDEVVEILFADLLHRNKKLKSVNFKVIDLSTGKEKITQVVYNEKKLPQFVLIQSSNDAKQTKKYEILEGTPTSFNPLTYGRFVPERLDDFAWENDRIAHRVYGPALEKTGELSNGIDVWVKRTDSLVINKWYKLDNYHEDHGEGLDCFKVGRTLGCGGEAPYIHDKLWLANNFVSYTILENGPLRTTFKLDYASFVADGILIKEHRTISLSAGSQLSKISVTYEMKEKKIPIAVGLVTRNGEDKRLLQEKYGILGYWEPKSAENGTIGQGAILPEGGKMAIAEGHLLAISNLYRSEPFTYYAGACWDKAGRIKTAEEWFNYLKRYSEILKSPLRVSVR